METNVEKKSVFLTAFAGEGDDQVRCTTVVDTIKDATKFANFLSDLFEIEAIVTVGPTFLKSELVYQNDTYKELNEGAR